MGNKVQCYVLGYCTYGARVMNVILIYSVYYKRQNKHTTRVRVMKQITVRSSE